MGTEEKREEGDETGVFESSFFSSLLLCETSVFSVVKTSFGIVTGLIGRYLASEHPSRRAQTSAPQDEVGYIISSLNTLIKRPHPEETAAQSSRRMLSGTTLI
jgi:hypothetical protein